MSAPGAVFVTKRWGARILLLLMLTLAWSLLTSPGTVQAQEADPYAPWSHGHPQESIPLLLDRAQSSDHWDAWLDLGLAAAASNDHRATAWLLRAHLLAPERPEPRAALLTQGVVLPVSWIDQCWPVSWIGCSWPGVICLALATLALGFFCCARSGRRPALVIALIFMALALPGQICLYLDGRTHLLAIVHDTHLLDSVGNPGEPLSAGSVVIQDASAQPRWNGRILVRTFNGQHGFLPAADCAEH